MPEPYNPANVHHDAITMPMDGELATAASLVGIEEVADNCEYVRQQLVDFAGTNLAHTNVDNNFTAGQHITGELETTGAIISGGHLKAGGPTGATGGSVYSGDGGQVVSDTNVTAGANVFAGANVEAEANVEAGADVTAVAGNLNAPAGNVNAAGAVIGATGISSVGGIQSAGGIWTTGTEHISAGGSLYAGVDGQVRAGTNVVAVAGNFNYGNTRTRTTNLVIQHAHPKMTIGVDPIIGYEAKTPTAYGWQALRANAVIELPLDLPHGAMLRRIDVYHNQGLTVQDTMRLVKWRVADWTDPSVGFELPAYSNGDSSAAGDGPRITPIHVNQEIDAGYNYFVEFIAGLANSRFMAVRVIWEDPGPRNY